MFRRNFEKLERLATKMERINEPVQVPVAYDDDLLAKFDAILGDDDLDEEE